MYKVLNDKPTETNIVNIGIGISPDIIHFQVIQDLMDLWKEGHVDVDVPTLNMIDNETSQNVLLPLPQLF